MERRSRSSHKHPQNIYDDEYILQPLKPNDSYKHLLRSTSNPPEIDSTHPSMITNFDRDHRLKLLEKKYLGAPRVPLTNDIIKSIADLVGSDSSRCYNDIIEFKVLSKKKFLRHYESLYRNLRTIPIVFLSISKHEDQIQAIYLWQFNEYCPIGYGEPKFIPIDVKVLEGNFVPHSSILLLAKIVPEKGEELVEAKLIDDSRLLVKSVIDSLDLVIRIYEMIDFKDTAKINPHEHKQYANDNFKYKAVLSTNQINNGEIECTLIRKRGLTELNLSAYNQAMAPEDTKKVQRVEADIIVSTEHLKLGKNYKLTKESFAEILPSDTSKYIVLVDKESSSILVWENEVLKVFTYEEIGKIQSVFREDDILYIINSEGKIFRFDIKATGEVQLTNLNLTLPLESKELEKNEEFETNSFKVIILPDLSHIIYYSDHRFYKLQLKENASPTLLYDLRNTFSGNDSVMTVSKEARDIKQELSWETIGEELVYLHGIDVHFYNWMTGEKKVYEKCLQGDNSSIMWKLIASKKRLFAYGKMHGLTYSIIKEVQLNEVTEEQSSKLTKLELCNNSKGTKSVIQLKEPEDEIVFVGLGEEKYFCDETHHVRGLALYLTKPPVYQKEEKKEKESSEERKDDINFSEKVRNIKMGNKNDKPVKQEVKEQKQTLNELRKAIKVTSQKAENDLEKNNKDKEGSQGLKTQLKEYKHFYQEVKQEKKKVEKQREKDKQKNKEGRNSRKDF